MKFLNGLCRESHRVLKATDEGRGDHALLVGEYCTLLANHLKIPENRTKLIRLQASLHDIGKIKVSPSILEKSGALTEDEWREMQRHTVYGSRIIGSYPRLTMAAKIALCHHERYDGTGYPYGISGEKIPIEGRILTLADQYDALRTVRCYKPAFDHGTTYNILTEGDGRTLPQHFDPRVLAAFKEIHSRFADVKFESL